MFNIEYIYSMGLSLLLSMLIGWEREVQDKPAGFRDVMLVCLGATLFTIISLILREVPNTTANLRYDFGRIIAYTIAGIGFLGSGIILKGKGKIVEGVTTAGVLWSVVGTGILCGLQEYILASISAIFIYFVLKLKYVKIIIEKKTKND